MISYKKATLNDISILVDYRIEFLIDFWGPQEQKDIDELAKKLKGIFTGYYEQNNYLCYIAYDGSTVAGIGGMTLREQPGNFKNPSGKAGYLLNMYTIPKYRRMGICSTILNMLTEDAVALGIIAFELHATKEGEPVYIKHGFRIHSEPTYRKMIIKESK